MQRRFEIKAIHSYARMHLSDWFPKLPSYQAFDRRLGELSPAFSALAERLMTQRQPEGIDMNMLLGDSMPILLAKGSRSGLAKVAGELCSKTYNASRAQWYYGMKLHVIRIKRHQTLPFPTFIFASKASCHDLPIAKQMLDAQSFRGFVFVGDKAYADVAWKASLLNEGIELLTPTSKNADNPNRFQAAMPWTLLSVAPASQSNLFSIADLSEALKIGVGTYKRICYASKKAHKGQINASDGM